MRAFARSLRFVAEAALFACKMRFPCAVATEGTLAVLTVRALFAVRPAEGTLAVLTVQAFFAVRPAEGALLRRFRADFLTFFRFNRLFRLGFRPVLLLFDTCGTGCVHSSR